MSARVKICGLRTVETLAAALEARADMVGFVFHPRSPRNIAIPDAADLAEFATGMAAVVALTVDADDALLDAIVTAVRPALLQLHGQETPERVGMLRERYDRPVMKAISVSTAADAALALAYRDVADLILFDAKPPKDAAYPGGHGRTFDWSALDGIKDQVPFMLSGGLTPANVADAIQRTGARTVDVSSGVESAPGVKDPDLIRAFIKAAKGVNRART